MTNKLLSNAILFVTLLLTGTAYAEQPDQSRQLRIQQRRGIVISPYQTIYSEKKFATQPGQCSLQKFAMVQQEYRSSSTEDKVITENSGVYAYLHTTDSSCNRNYGIVQYIKGCAVESRKSPDGQWKSGYMLYQSRGKYVDFYMPEWTVDTVDVDPMYASTSPGDNADRMYKYYTPKARQILSDANKVKLFNYCGQYENRTMIGQNIGPQKELLFVTDYPSGSYVDPNNQRYYVENATLDFKICVYHRKDIPTSGNPKFFDVPTAQGGPIACLDWSSNHVWDMNKKKFTKAKSVLDICKY